MASLFNSIPFITSNGYNDDRDNDNNNNINNNNLL